MYPSNGLEHTEVFGRGFRLLFVPLIGNMWSSPNLYQNAERDHYFLVFTYNKLFPGHKVGYIR